MTQWPGGGDWETPPPPLLARRTQWTVKCVPLSVVGCRCPCQSNRCPGIGFKREMRSNCIKMPTQKHKNYGHTWRPAPWRCGCHKQHACCGKAAAATKDQGCQAGVRDCAPSVGGVQAERSEGSPHAASEIKLASPQQRMQQGSKATLSAFDIFTQLVLGQVLRCPEKSQTAASDCLRHNRIFPGSRYLLFCRAPATPWAPSAPWTPCFLFGKSAGSAAKLCLVYVALHIYGPCGGA